MPLPQAAPTDSITAAPLAAGEASATDSATAPTVADTAATAPTPNWQVPKPKVDYMLRPDRLGTFEKMPLPTRIDALTGDTASTFKFEVETAGMEGRLQPYRFKNDDVVTAVLMLSFFLAVWVVTNSRKYLINSAKNIFRIRERENLFSERTDTELRGGTFLIFETCLMLGILFVDYTQNRLPEVLDKVSPYHILAVGTGGCLAYYLVKNATYSFINNVFFERQQKERWNEVYALGLITLGLLLLPVALLVVYFDLSFDAMCLLTLAGAAVVKLLLFFKCFSIFFRRPVGWVHLILYFCTLEMMPLLMLWRALVFAVRSLPFF